MHSHACFAHSGSATVGEVYAPFSGHVRGSHLRGPQFEAHPRSSWEGVSDDLEVVGGYPEAFGSNYTL